jgi:hypothetical protein
MRIPRESTLSSSKWSLSLRSPHRKPVCTCPRPHTCYMLRYLILIYLKLRKGILQQCLPLFLNRGKSTKKFCRPKKLIVKSEIRLVFEGKYLNRCLVNVLVYKLKKKLAAPKINQIWQNRIKFPATFKIYILNFSRCLKPAINLFHYFSPNWTWLGNRVVRNSAIPNSPMQLFFRNVL